MKHIILSNGKTLEGVIGGAMKTQGENAVLNLMIVCTPTINGKPINQLSGLVDASGNPVAPGDPESTNGTEDDVEVQQRPVDVTHAWKTEGESYCGQRTNGSWSLSKVTCMQCYSAAKQEMGDNGRPLT